MRKWLAVVVVVVLVAAVAAWRGFRVSTLVHIGAGYAAQQTCACLFISKRPLESCRGDLEPLAQRIVSIEQGADAVTATTLHLSRATSRYQRGFGCSLSD